MEQYVNANIFFSPYIYFSLIGYIKMVSSLMEKMLKRTVFQVNCWSSNQSCQKKKTTKKKHHGILFFFYSDVMKTHFHLVALTHHNKGPGRGGIQDTNSNRPGIQDSDFKQGETQNSNFNLNGLIQRCDRFPLWDSNFRTLFWDSYLKEPHDSDFKWLGFKIQIMSSGALFKALWALINCQSENQ